jgi:PucR C-terminal helix-turn-helix domain/GGDEF-like domain
MKCDTVAQQVAEVAKTLHRRLDELAPELARTVVREVRPHHPSVVVPFDVVAASCETNMRSVLTAIAADSAFDLTPATHVGADQARRGVPLSSVMDAYRVGFHRLWETAVAEATTSAQANGDAVCALTAKLLAAHDVCAAAMAVGYRDEQARLRFDNELQRSALIDSLLYGRVFEQWSLWETANYLHLPSTGPFVVIAAQALAAGAEALPNIEAKLRSLDVCSAWWPLPDLQVGIVHVKTDQCLDKILRLVAHTATTRVGVSPRFTDLHDTAQALRYARVVLHGHPDSELVTVFDGSILATAAVSAPEVMVKLVHPVLERFADLDEDERNVLFDTFKAWVQNDGSLQAASRQLCCHPNTVRYRLHRIERRTGRSLSRPRDLAELCLVLEVHRRLL